MKEHDDLDLTITRIIRAPRSIVWKAWTEPEQFEKWWAPAPVRAKVVEMDLRPGGAFLTKIVTQTGQIEPHMNACFLEVEQNRRIIFTTSLTSGWRPAPQPFIDMTAIITLAEHVEGTRYTALVMHKDKADRQRHANLGFADGWSVCAEQLATIALSLTKHDELDYA